MTRFQQELSGALGEYWRKDALKEIEKTRKEFESGEITIDADGVARNCIGRAEMAAAFGEGEQVVDILTGERFCF